MWIVFVFISIFCYAFGEVFQKKGSGFEEEHTSLKILVWFGIISVVMAFEISFFNLKETSSSALTMIYNNPVIILSPLFYFLSLFLCFLAFKLIPASIVAPITGAEGVFTFIAVIIMFLLLGKSALLDESITPLKLILVIISIVGIYASGLIQSKIEDKEDNKKLAHGKFLIKSGRFAAIGVILAVSSALVETASVLVDIYALGDLVDSYDYLYTYEVLIAIFTLVVYAVLWYLEKKPYNPFKKSENFKMLGAGCDNLGLAFYMLAISRNPLYTDVLTSSFCIFAVLLSKIVLKEKLKKSQKIWTAITLFAVVSFVVVDELI